MSDAYTIASRLTFSTNATQIIADLFRSFERLDQLIASTQGNLNRLGTEMRTLNQGARGLGRSVEALERLSTVRVSPELVTGMERVARSATEAATASRAVERATNRAPAVGGGGGGNRAPAGGAGGQAPRGAAGHSSFTHHDLLNTSMGLDMAGDAGLGFFGGAVKAEAEVRTQLAALRMNSTVTEAEVNEARTVAERITKLTPGTTTAGNVKTILEAYTALGDLHEAMLGAPAMAQMSYVLENIPGAHKGDHAFAAAQAIEVMQRMYDPKTGKISMDAFNQQLAAMTQVSVGTQGRADPEKYLAFAKQSRVGGMVANDQFLYRDLPAMMIALGGSRAGTGEAATFQQFVTGRMTKNAADHLKAAGLLDKSARWKGGTVQDMQHKFHGYDMFGANAVEWTRQYMLGPQGALAQNKIDPNDRLAVAKFLSDWSGRQTGLGFMSEMTLGMQGIDKEGTKIDQTTRDPMAVLRQSDPMQAVREFKAAENDLMISLGKEALGPAIEALKSLTEAINSLSAWAKAHPETAKDLVLVGGGLSILAKGVGEVALVLYLGAPIVTGIRALAGAVTLFAVGTPAGLALTALTLGISALAAVLSGMHLPDHLLGPPSPAEDQRMRQQMGRDHPSSLVPNYDPDTGRPLARPQSYLAPPDGNQHFTIMVNGQVDGQTLLKFVSRGLAKSMSGPSTGTTGFDVRAATVGSNATAA